MFKFLKKDKNKEETIVTVETPPITEEEEKRYIDVFLSENPDAVLVEEEPEEISEEPTAEPVAEEPGQKKGFFARLKGGLDKTRASLNDKINSVLKAFVKVDEELFEELEEALISADVGVNTSLYIIERLRDTVKERRITESVEVREVIEEIICEILAGGNNELVMEGKPAVILVIGVNGVGKTTSIGKMAARLTAQGKKVVLGAADTFRAAAADQLQIWAERVGCDIIRLQEGADPAAVVFDTVNAARARGADVVIIDTAGRLHNKKNLMDELNKISRVLERELPESSKEVLLVIDATTGQNAVSQVQQFQEAAGITGIVLTKLDGTAKGGIVIAIAHDRQIPVKFVGVGEGIDDMQEFNPEDFSKALFGE
ncbi:MAG: signal recognition particle-docking protein FtsY [Clostridia bacterium]|nr:signal recognition particle-docking protein FtsY [Clostridia bacterium]